MSEQLNSFDLKLLTSSKEVGLRRLRSYAASLGGGAQIFNSYDDLRRNLEGSFFGQRLNIVLHDHSLPIAAPQMQELQRFARIFALQRPDHRHLVAIPPLGAACWQVECYMQCSLAAFLDSPIVRMSMAQMCQPAAPFHLAHLLRWGHAASTWSTGDRRGIADASVAFARELSLVSEGRRLTEMFSHFVQARLPFLRIRPEAVTFGADGLLITVIARCRPEASFALRDLVEELRIHDFPISVVNQLPTGEIEVAALHYPFQPPHVAHERIVLCFKKSEAAANGAMDITQMEAG